MGKLEKEIKGQSDGGNKLPALGETSGRIRKINQRLHTFAQQIIGDQPFDFDREIGELPEEKIVLREGLTVSAFWNHHLGSEVSQARLLVEEAQFKGGVTAGIAQMLVIHQRRTAGLLLHWSKRPVLSDSLEQASTQASLEATRAFHWGAKPDLLFTLNDEVVNLGEQYALLDGKRLL